MTTVTQDVGVPLASMHVGRARHFKNRAATVLVTAAFVVALVPLVWLLWTVISKGIHAVTQNGWFNLSQRNLTFTDPGGGALHAIIGTAEPVAYTHLRAHETES